MQYNGHKSINRQNVSRQGKRHEGENPGPLKVVFEDEKSKGLLMSSLKNLKDAGEPFRMVSVEHDMAEKKRKGSE